MTGLLAAALPWILSLGGCELLIPGVTRGRGGALVVKEGRIRALPADAASAGSVRVIDAALDIGPPACAGDGAYRTCVRGGITGQGRD